MSWDSRSRRRQNSTASSRSLPSHARQKSKQVSQPKSDHVSDPFLQDFLASNFDPAEYLNATLPPLQTSSSARPGSQASAAAGTAAAVPLSELSTQAQTNLTQLNAHTTRLTATLTQLTDEILRSGSRLAYEVELLRGETLGLAETLTDGLQDEVAQFVPGGIRDAPEVAARQRRASIVSRAQTDADAAPHGAEPSEAAPTAAAAPDGTSDPEYIAHLRTLTVVRSRLDSVIKTFGDAMEFVFPPSEISVSSSFLSVSGPDPGPEMHSTEEKGQRVLAKLREEVAALLSPKAAAGTAADPIKGIEDAARRIEELKELTRVWKGTAEEKGRAKFIESLAKMVEDRHRELLREVEQQQSKASRSGSDSPAGRMGGAGASDSGGPGDSKGYVGGYGLIQQLQKIRSGL
ncbi:uncharacterized protein E0L32_010466 [Thyridium curvatum]|uniref:Uncharacterized protein n=1 Tax=Thyridium curvatum TaxID=1093900 RepID=A0A507ASK8_9PEZI|nr:uncharacterized protein E0L32_010466 [Thyridium curvatum]TPX07891.1 hypothetical protein E0L32_010466 [Thyridium curvatum]